MSSFFSIQGWINAHAWVLTFTFTRSQGLELKAHSDMVMCKRFRHISQLRPVCLTVVWARTEIMVPKNLRVMAWHHWSGDKRLNYLGIYCFHFFPAGSLLDSRDVDREGSEQDRQPDGLQSVGNASSGSQSQQLCTSQRPQAPCGPPSLPELVHGHYVGRAESGDFPEEGEDCMSLLY